MRRRVGLAPISPKGQAGFPFPWAANLSSAPRRHRSVTFPESPLPLGQPHRNVNNCPDLGADWDFLSYRGRGCRGLPRGWKGPATGPCRAIKGDLQEGMPLAVKGFSPGSPDEGRMTS